MQFLENRIFLLLLPDGAVDVVVLVLLLRLLQSSVLHTLSVLLMRDDDEADAERGDRDGSSIVTLSLIPCDSIDSEAVLDDMPDAGFVSAPTNIDLAPHIFVSYGYFLLIDFVCVCVCGCVSISIVWYSALLNL